MVLYDHIYGEGRVTFGKDDTIMLHFKGLKWIISYYEDDDEDGYELIASSEKPTRRQESMITCVTERFLLSMSSSMEEIH